MSLAISTGIQVVCRQLLWQYHSSKQFLHTNKLGNRSFSSSLYVFDLLKLLSTSRHICRNNCHTYIQCTSYHLHILHLGLLKNVYMIRLR